MKRIDAHQHFWVYEPNEYPWIKPDWPIRRSFVPPDLAPLLKQCGLDGCVAVQARQTVRETEWLLELAGEFPIIAGVVGWVDLRSATVEEQLARFSSNRKLVGVRHVVQDEPNDRFMLGTDFLRGLGALRQFDLAYDLLIFPHQLAAAIEVARRFPDQRFVLDHIAKPPIKSGQIEPWSTRIRELSQSPNVYCKLSGMVTEADWHGWKPEHFKPYLEVIWDAFGVERLMIGSDWPVCLLSADYERTMKIVLDLISQFSEADQEKVLGSNAIRFYRLPV